jgi:hypothetical protein
MNQQEDIKARDQKAPAEKAKTAAKKTSIYDQPEHGPESVRDDGMARRNSGTMFLIKISLLFGKPFRLGRKKTRSPDSGISRAFDFLKKLIGNSVFHITLKPLFTGFFASFHMNVESLLFGFDNGPSICW